jgi:hypothetical protein
MATTQFKTIYDVLGFTTPTTSKAFSFLFRGILKTLVWVATRKTTYYISIGAYISYAGWKFYQTDRKFVVDLFNTIDKFEGLAEECLDTTTDDTLVVASDQIGSLRSHKRVGWCEAIGNLVGVAYGGIKRMHNSLRRTEELGLPIVEEEQPILECAIQVYRPLAYQPVVVEAVHELQVDLGERNGLVMQAERVEHVKKHRRVHSGMPFVAALVAEIKCQLGVPNKTEANILVVRRLANNLCTERRVRPTHAKFIVGLVVSLVFIPDEEDVTASEVASSHEAARRIYRYQRASDKSLFSRLSWWLPGWFGKQGL